MNGFEVKLVRRGFLDYKEINTEEEIISYL